MKFVVSIIVLLIFFGCGFFIGSYITNPHCENYYENICAREYHQDMTTDEVLTTLKHMQWTHQRWADNPQWYPDDNNKQEREIRLVETYGDIIHWVIEHGN